MRVHSPSSQTDVPLDFATGEVPSPIPGNGKTGGYPITLYFPGNDPVRIVAATLHADGRTVPVHLSSPADPVTEFSRDGVVSMIPKAPLLPQTTYSVSITTELAGRRTTVQSSFTTAGLSTVDAADGWRQPGENGGDPGAWRGDALQVDATPRQVGTRAIKLRIDAVRQFMTGPAR